MNLANIISKRIPTGNIRITFNGEFLGEVQSISYGATDHRGRHQTYTIGNIEPMDEELASESPFRTIERPGAYMNSNGEWGEEPFEFRTGRRWDNN